MGLKLFLLLTLLLLPGCADLDFTVVNLPAYFSSDQVESDIAFDDNVPGLKLDIYHPAGTKAPGPAPVIVFFYGGRWETGRKEDYAFVGHSLAERGFLTVIADYRKYPSVPFPTFVDDAAAALAWAADHAAAYGGDPHHIIVMGHSAGAHIALLALTVPHYLAYWHHQSAEFAGFIGLAGPYDFVPDESDLVAMFGPSERYPLMQISHFITGSEPPMLLLGGNDDTDVNPSNIRKLMTAIHAKHGCASVKFYDKTDHIWLLGSLSWLGRISIEDDIVAFAERPRCGHD